MRSSLKTREYWLRPLPYVWIASLLLLLAGLFFLAAQSGAVAYWFARCGIEPFLTAEECAAAFVIMLILAASPSLRELTIKAADFAFAKSRLAGGRLSRLIREAGWRRVSQWLSAFICLYGAITQYADIPAVINPADETVYIRDGIAMLHGHWPSFADFPVASLYYALLAAVFRHGAVSTIGHAGHAIDYLLAWAGVLALSASVENGYLVAVLVCIVRVIAPETFNVSDTLFSSLACFAAAAALRRRFLLGVGLEALAGMARPDGLWIAVLLIAYCVLMVDRRTAALGLLICAGVLGLNSFGQALSDHRLGLHRPLLFSGMKERAYFAFEQGEGVSWADARREGTDPSITGVEVSARLYGSQEQNQSSILRAIEHNPGPYLSRVAHNVCKLPRQISLDYSGWAHEGTGCNGKGAYSPWLFELMAFGLLLAVVLSKQRLLVLAFILPFAAYCLTFYRDGYIFAYAPLFFWGMVEGWSALYRTLRGRLREAPGDGPIASKEETPDPPAAHPAPLDTPAAEPGMPTPQASNVNI